jgi:hypothetical protein
MNSTTPPSRLERIHERLTQSKYWTVSLFIHAVAIAVLSTLVLVKQAQDDDPDFTSTGGFTTDTPPPPQTIDEGPERPPETQITESRPKAPNVSTPVQPGGTTGPTINTPLVTTGAVTGMKIPLGTTDPVPLQPGSSVPTHIPSSMGARFTKNAKNHITMKSGKGPTPTSATEEAVLRGLNWLRDHQNDDGSWGEKNKGAMTGLALLSFLGHGETGNSPHYGLTVNKALEWILREGTKHQSRLSMTTDGWGPGNGGVYEHGILTYALGEYCSMTKEERPLELLRGAVQHILDGQGPDGGWMYHYDKTQSDTSVSGWQIQALKAAHLAGVNLPGVDKALDRAMQNLDRVQGPKGGYGYRTPGDRYSLSGVGVLCELFWKDRRDNKLNDAVKFILDQAKDEPVEYQHEKADLYAWYYHTQAMLMYGGPAWLEWEPKFRTMALKSQAADGSWPVMKSAGHGALQNSNTLTGAVYRTTLNILMLEAYYRYLPLNRALIDNQSIRIALR